MDRDKMREEIAKMLDEIRDEYCLSDHESRLVYSDRILSLLAPVFEKAGKWDALTKKYPHFCTRFDPEIDGEVKDETK